MSINSKAPVDALLTVGFNGQLFFFPENIDLTPKNKEERIIAPKF
jgi:hypothetical protein